MRRLHAGATLYHDGAAADSIYGACRYFKTYRTAEDGYEQVLGLARRAEVLGSTPSAWEHHPTAAVALEDSSVFVLPVQDVFTLGHRLPALDRVHPRSTGRTTRNWPTLMAPVAAEVAGTISDAALAAHGGLRQSPRRFHLRMSRRDIARYLGVAHETVSRSFGALAQWGCVRVDNREVEIADMGRLKTFARSTRRQSDEPMPAGITNSLLVRPATLGRVAYS
jgi:CRP/FNR family transcriptional regulator